MLFTEEEVREWKRQQEEAYAERPGDNHHDRWTRREAIAKAWRNERLTRMRARPEAVLRAIVTHAGERACVGITELELWGDPAHLEGRYAAANTPQTRWLVGTMLQALTKVPRSWAKSATTRFFRGIGKQKDAKYPGAGILSADRGWREREAEALVSMFYVGEVGALFMEDVSVDPYGKDGREVAEDGGNQFAATRKERDDAFIADLIARIEAQGVEEPVVEAKAPPKPRKAKVFAPGDVVTASNLRDVPADALLRMVYVTYDYGYGKPEFTGVEYTFEMVFVSREIGMTKMRPIAKGKAFAVRDIPSSNLYATRYRYDEIQTTYLGQWTGEVVDVAIADDAWKPVKERKVYRRREGKYPDEKIVAVEPA